MKEKILIMDDEPLVLAAMEKALSRVGYAVTAVSNLPKYKKALGEEEFDLAILDLHLPDAEVENLVKEAVKKNPAMKFIYVSGADSYLESKNFLQKPFRIEELRRLVRTALDEP